MFFACSFWCPFYRMHLLWQRSEMPVKHVMISTYGIGGTNNVLSRSIISIYESTTHEERNIGSLWYGEARAVCCDMAIRYDTTTVTVAGIVACLSPRKHWQSNLLETRNCLSGNKIGHFGFLVDRAKSIRDGALPLDVLSGDKTRNFYRAIMGDLNACVIDTWMILAYDNPRNSLSPKQYERLADCLRRDAAALGVYPADLQAIVWCKVRGFSE